MGFFPFSLCFNPFPLPLSHPFFGALGNGVHFLIFFACFLFFSAFLLLEKVLISVFWEKGASALSNTGAMALGWAWASVDELRLC